MHYITFPIFGNIIPNKSYDRDPKYFVCTKFATKLSCNDTGFKSPPPVQGYSVSLDSVLDGKRFLGKQDWAGQGWARLSSIKQ